MSFISRLFAVLALFTLWACTDVPQAEPCPSAEACAFSELMVQGFAPDIGMDFGGGVKLRNVQAAGALVVIDIEVPLPGGSMEDVQKRAIHQITAQGFLDGFCEGPDAQEVFSFGNAFQVRSVGNDGVLLGASTIRSCGG